MVVFSSIRSISNCVPVPGVLCISAPCKLTQTMRYLQSIAQGTQGTQGTHLFGPLHAVIADKSILYDRFALTFPIFCLRQPRHSALPNAGPSHSSEILRLSGPLGPGTTFLFLRWLPLDGPIGSTKVVLLLLLITWCGRIQKEGLRDARLKQEYSWSMTVDRYQSQKCIPSLIHVDVVVYNLFLVLLLSPF